MRKERSMPAMYDLEWPKFKALHDMVELKSSSSRAWQECIITRGVEDECA